MLTRIGSKVTVGRPLCNVLRIGRPLEGGGSFLRDWTVYGKSEVVGSSVLGVGDAGSTFTSLPIVASNRNLFDAGQPVQSGKFPNANGTISVNANYRYLTIAVKPNTNYTIKNHLAGFTGEAYAGFVQSKEPIAGDSCSPFYVTRNNATTRNSGAYGYLMIAFWFSAESALADIQVEEGTTATEFVTHQSQRFPLVISSPLHGIGDVRDIMRYSLHGITRKYGVVDMGTLNWDRQDSGYGYYRFSANVSAKKPGVFNIICARYSIATSSSGSAFLDGQIKGFGGINTITVRDDSISTSAEFKAATQGVLLVYELATPTFEPVTLPKLPAYRDGTVLYTDTQVHGDTIAGEAPVGFSLLPPVTMTPPTGDGDTNGQTDDAATE